MVKEKTDSNRVKTLKVGNLELAGVEVRTLLGLRSTDFTYTIEGNNIKFSVIGYGHGVGIMIFDGSDLDIQIPGKLDFVGHAIGGLIPEHPDLVTEP